MSSGKKEFMGKLETKGIKLIQGMFFENDVVSVSSDVDKVTAMMAIKLEEKPIWGTGCAVINKEGKILMGLRCKSGDKKEWSFVGGKVEIGESPVNAMFREIKEESNLDAKHINYIDVFEYESVVDYIFTCSQYEGTPQPKLDEMSEMGFFSLDEIEKMHVYPYTKLAIEMLKEKGVI